VPNPDAGIQVEIVTPESSVTQDAVNSHEPPLNQGFRIPIRNIVIGLCGAILVITLMTLVADARDLASVLSDFNWWLLAPVILLSLWNYALRFIKWEYFLEIVGVEGLPKRESARIFLAGFAMVLTPGKVGEYIKAVYVRRKTGFAADRVASVITAERGTDAIAMAILALIGATQYSYGRGLLAVVVAGAVAVVVMLQRPALFDPVLRWLQRFSFVRASTHHITAFLEASSQLFRVPVLSRAVVISFISWAGECVAFFLILIGLGLKPSAELLLLATFILAVSSLAGGISLLPGGLGVADASVAGMLLLLVNDDALTRSVAVGATLLIRFATLWFAVIIGFVYLFSLEREHTSSTAGKQ